MKKNIMTILMVGGVMAVLLGLPQIQEGYAKTDSDKTKPADGTLVNPIDKAKGSIADDDDEGDDFLPTVVVQHTNLMGCSSVAACCNKYNCKSSCVPSRYDDSTSGRQEYTASCDCGRDKDGKNKDQSEYATYTQETYVAACLELEHGIDTEIVQ